uniref:TSA: Wollemia nobilis Ref_Wollemi_Transcript_13568_1070 transcribed RNA sequence n=1 Tax=Wollemia nobilis TaxID=56998 RepID=A0A0C9S7H0_9CONI
MAMTMGRASLLWLLHVAGLLCVYVQEAGAINFNIVNQCSYTVWAAGIPVGGGKELASGASWSVDVPAGTSAGRFWGRTGCTFDQSGRGSCQTGDCGGALSCTLSGNPPTTLAEYTLTSTTDTYDISLVDGFNVPLSFAPTNAQCTSISCKGIDAVCPSDLQVSGGCYSACNKYNTPQYCCTGSYLNNCPSNSYSQIFKTQCPQAFSYADDGQTSNFPCATGTDYKIVFCP